MQRCNYKFNRSGEPNDLTSKYYLKVTGQNTLKVYSDARMTVPVSGIGFDFGGFTTTNVTGCTSGTDSITLTSVAGFSLNDEVIFEGTIPIIQLMQLLQHLTILKQSTQEQMKLHFN